MITVVSWVEWDHSQSPSSFGSAAIWILVRADQILNEKFHLPSYKLKQLIKCITQTLML